MPLHQLTSQSKMANWQYARNFFLCRVAKEWGRRPSEFGVCDPEEDPTFMAAYELTIQQMRQVEAEWRK